MTLAAKENSVDSQGRPQVLNGKLAERKPSQLGEPRVALAAKSLNTDCLQSTTERGSANSSDLKRAASRGSSFNNVFSQENKRHKILTGNEQNDDETTDEDDPTPNTGVMASTRNSTPFSLAHSQRPLPRQLPLYPRPKITDYNSLGFDYPVANTLSPIVDDDDSLDGFELKRPRLGPPRYLPEFLRNVEKSVHIGLTDFPDLAISDDESEDPDASYLELRITC